MAFPRNQQRNVVLTGFYASGKRRIGRELARRMNRIFLDVPEELARRSRQPLSRLVGWGKHDLPTQEARLIRELSFRRNLVIALGAESLRNPSNLDEIRTTGYAVFVDAPFSMMWDRLSSDRDYAGIVDGMDRHDAHLLWQSLLPGYEQADLHLTSEGNGLWRPVQYILHCFYT